MLKRKGFLMLILSLALCVSCALADPSLEVLDSAVRSGSPEEVYAAILEEHAGSIQAYQDHVLSVTSLPACHPVGFPDLNGDRVPELLFLDLEEDPEYGFQLGRLWIYTWDGAGAHCALTLKPETDDLLYSRVYASETGALTVWFADMEQGWGLRLLPDLNGNYATETTLVSQMDFSGEGPDTYYLNGKKLSAKKYKAQEDQLAAGQGTLIGSLMIDDGGSGFTHTLQEAREALSSGSFRQTSGDESELLGQLPELTFAKGRFTAGQKFPVYSAPSARSWRGAKGKAAVMSGNEIFTAGSEDGWILILYELDSGVIRAGYIDSAKITGSYDAPASLSFPRIQLKLTSGCEMNEDPIRQKSVIGKLKKGTAVTCLAKYRSWLYVEAKVSGKTARGFISASGY